MVAVRDHHCRVLVGYGEAGTQGRIEGCGEEKGDEWGLAKMIRYSPLFVRLKDVPVVVARVGC